jgi:hypothetical protein
VLVGEYKPVVWTALWTHSLTDVGHALLGDKSGGAWSLPLTPM